MTADLPPDTAERLAGTLPNPYGRPATPSEMYEACLPVVAEIADAARAEGAAEATQRLRREISSLFDYQETCATAIRQDGPTERSGALRAFAEWVVALDDDDPESPGRLARRTVRLDDLIRRARAALNEAPR